MDTPHKDYCYLARILLEASTPMKIGSGSESIVTDSTVARDVNGLPYIPATTIMGLVRHRLKEEDAKRIMGFQDKRDGHGSWLTVSEGKILDQEGKAVDGLKDPDVIEKDSFLKGFVYLPIRQHVKIDHRGTAEKGAKFDEEIIPKGTRFVFELELRSDSGGESDFTLLLDALRSETFRIGGGSRKGFGELKIVDIRQRVLCLKEPADFQAYLDKPSSLENTFFEAKDKEDITRKEEGNAIHYTLSLKPVDFILFSSGFGDLDTGIDMAVVREPYISWVGDRGSWEPAETSLVIPASSVKGAIAHRTAYHYNQLVGKFADKIAERAETYTGENNTAVKELFGVSGKSGDKSRGRVLFSDIIRKTSSKTKPINHVKIDRFTGGAIDGALFDEEPLYAKGEDFKMDITLLKDKDLPEHVLEAFEKALEDLCKGLLPLGGGVNRGNGCMEGSLSKDGEQIYPSKPKDNLK